MRHRILAAGAVLLAVASSSANAQDLWSPPTANSWTGFYIGGSAGGVVDGSAHWDYTSNGIPPINLPQFGDDLSGGLYGGYVGYNHQWGQIVLGIEGDLGTGDIGGSEPCENTALFTCTTDIDDIYAIRGRLGWAFDHVLIYGTAGWARADVSLVATNGAISFTGQDDVDGYVAGGGAELKIANHMSIGVEALYYNFDETIAPWIDSRTGLSVGQQNFEADFTVVRGRLTLHLN